MNERTTLPQQIVQVPAQEPTRTPGIQADVGVPLLQAVVTGSIVGFLFIAVALLAEWDLSLRQWGLMWLVPTLAVTSLMWLIRLRWIDSTIMRVEGATGLDINRDGVVGPPPHAMSVNRKATAERTVIQREQERLEAFVNACFRVGTSTRALRAQGFTDGEIARFRALLMRPDVGVARWKSRSPKDGWLIHTSHAEVLDVIGRLQWLPGGSE